MKAAAASVSWPLLLTSSTERHPENQHPGIVGLLDEAIVKEGPKSDFSRREGKLFAPLTGEAGAAAGTVEAAMTRQAAVPATIAAQTGFAAAAAAVEVGTKGEATEVEAEGGIDQIACLGWMTRVLGSNLTFRTLPLAPLMH